MAAYFDIPLHLPHAGTVAARILRLLEAAGCPEEDGPAATAARLDGLLLP